MILKIVGNTAGRGTQTHDDMSFSRSLFSRNKIINGSSYEQSFGHNRWTCNDELHIKYGLPKLKFVKGIAGTIERDTSAHHSLSMNIIVQWNVSMRFVLCVRQSRGMRSGGLSVSKKYRNSLAIYNAAWSHLAFAICHASSKHIRVQSLSDILGERFVLLWGASIVGFYLSLESIL